LGHLRRHHPSPSRPRIGAPRAFGVRSLAHVDKPAAGAEGTMLWFSRK
jgi:hypothetical protein